MEMITGKSANQLHVEGVLITQWVSSMFANGEIGEANFDVHSVEEALSSAFACLSHHSNDRPTMAEVPLKLKHCLQMETSPPFN